MFKYLDIFVYTLFITLCAHGVVGDSCGTCDESACAPPVRCLAGLVKDACDCCFVCGLREGERCDNEEVNFVGFGKCGDNLECRVRNDLAWNDPPEAVCVCTSESPMCASDGVTYDNICQLTEARYTRRDGLRAVSSSPCVKPPVIVNSPQNIKNSSGITAVMTCEANAWPVPVIQWLARRNQILEKLPGNSTRVAVQSRSGPGVYETTSWLLFMNIAKEDEGTYVCKAENDFGSDTATAKLIVTS